MKNIGYLPEDIIKCNFFKLGYSSQIQIYELYLNDLKSTEFYDDFKKVFEKYIMVVKKLVEFKSNFFKYCEDDRKKLRFIINKCRVRINPNNQVKFNNDVEFYGSENISNDYVEKYICDSFCHDRERRISIALEFLNCYYQIGSFDFEEILKLCSGNKDFFNHEIRILSGEFYSLYILMDTVDRMKYIWYLSHLNLLTVDRSADEIDMYEIFSNDKKFVKPLHAGSKELSGNSKRLAKYFNVTR